MMQYSSEKWNIKDTWNMLIMFAYLFFFRIQRVPYLSKLESTTILGILLFVLMLFSYRYTSVFMQTLQKYKNIRLIFWCISIMSIALIIALCHGFSDLSIYQPLFHQLVFIFVSIEVYSYLRYRNADNKIIEYIIIAYSLQTIVQYASFISPVFNSFTDFFKSEETIILKKQYSGFRLNAISGSLASGLACGYSIVTAIMLARWQNLVLTERKKYICLILLLLGGVAAGRVSIFLNITGGLIFVAYSFLKNRKVTITKKEIKFLLLLPILILVIIKGTDFVLNNVSDDFMLRLNTVKYWFSTMLNRYTLESDSFWDRSYSALGSVNFILGDGMYTNSDGSYYLHQDAGFVRIIAYGGIPWLISMLIYQYCFFKFKSRKVEIFALYSIILVATLKSDSLGIALQNQLILSLFYLYNTNTEKKSNDYLQCRCYSPSDSF